MRSTYLLLVGLAACGSTVKGNARIVRGASKDTSAGRSGVVAPAAADGHYLLSPNASTVTLTTLRFKGPDGGGDVPLTNCTPTYQRDTASLTSILDCPIEVDTGTYSLMAIAVAGTAQVTVDDPAIGLFTDASSSTKMSTTAPSGGAASVNITVPTAGDSGNEIQEAFAEPLVVEEGTPLTITIVEDMIHTMAADVQGGQASFDVSLPLPPVFLMATAGEVTSGTVEYYAPSGTADDFNIGPGGSGNEAGSARVFFVNGKPTFMWYVTDTPGSSESWAADPRDSDGSRAGGYLGLDSTGTLCWAHTNSDTLEWGDSSYSQICRMRRAANLGDTTTIECRRGSTVPAPTSGSTYESGCPSFTPDTTQTVTLVAK